jgi:hypothetical protein
LCGFVLATLEIGIDGIIAGVQLLRSFVIALCSGHGGDVAVDRILPIAGAGKSMRRHVQGVRRIGRNLGVTTRRIQRARSERRDVVGVNDVVREARVIRLLGK